MKYNEVMTSLNRQNQGWSADVSEDWLQGRSLYGGIQAALGIKAMKNHLAEPMPLRTLQVSFLAPIPAGSINLQVRTIRSGKNTQHCEARIMQGDDTLCMMIGIFGKSRESVVSVTPSAPPLPNKKPFPFPFVPNLTPAFTQHFKVHWLEGYLPFSGQQQNNIQISIELESDDAADAAYIATIADFMPPVALAHLTTPAPASSLTWLLEFFNEDSIPSQGAWRVAAKLDAAADGYTSQSMLILDPLGKPAALSRQSMVVFG